MQKLANKPGRDAKSLGRAAWQRPEVRRTRAGAAELTTDDFGGDIVWS
jgi:hypothetical protein